MPYLIGIGLAFTVAAFARYVRLDRDMAFYPTVLIVIASYYVLFAAMAGSPRAAAVEVAGMAPFIVVAAVGFRNNLWFVVCGLAAHGVLDQLHSALAGNDGAPPWWPSFCLAYDVTAALTLARGLVRQRMRTRI